ncbi:MAG: ABC transporter ATP-binding protein [Candidatus Nitrosocaldaceae archaeon]
MNIVEVKNLRKWFKVKRILGKSVTIKAVDGISFNINKGEVFVLAGESGSGKSTTARLILNAIKPDEGSIIFDGNDVTKLNGKELKRFRREAQMIHQDPYASLDPRMKIMDIVREPLSIHEKKNKKEEEEEVLKVLEEVKLEPAEEIATRYPHMLSGGQRQRVAIARALILRPKFIIADEPVSMLDISVRGEILDLLRDLQMRYNMTYLYITHDLSTARYVGNEIAIMYKGKIVEMGDIDKVLLNPLHPYTKALIEAISEPDPENLYREKNILINKSIIELNDYGCKFYQRCMHAMDRCKREPNLVEIEDKHSVACFLYS